MSAINDYRDALQRLVTGKPINVPKDSAINNDSVALEAGRKRGTIKKSRSEHSQLIEEIRTAAAGSSITKPTQNHNAMKQKSLKKDAQGKLELLKADYEHALTKIISLEHENHLLRLEVHKLKAQISEKAKIVRIGSPFVAADRKLTQ